jgi:Fur family ferric uptake transcriptional regulator
MFGTLRAMPSGVAKTTDPWAGARERLRARGLRWTPQRRLLLGVLAGANGHVTATELIERCREADPQTIPSTVYRTLDVLEDLGLVRHGHGADGHEEFHVLPAAVHGHLYCATCGTAYEISRAEADELIGELARRRGFTVDLSHLAVVGCCAQCSTEVSPPAK